MRPIRKGDEVRITFEDHVQDHDEPLVCCVRGLVDKVTRKAYTVKVWEVVGEYKDGNENTFTIIRSTIVGKPVRLVEFTENA